MGPHNLQISRILRMYLPSSGIFEVNGQHSADTFDRRNLAVFVQQTKGNASE